MPSRSTPSYLLSSATAGPGSPQRLRSIALQKATWLMADSVPSVQESLRYRLVFEQPIPNELTERLVDEFLPIHRSENS